MQDQKLNSREQEDKIPKTTEKTQKFKETTKQENTRGKRTTDASLPRLCGGESAEVRSLLWDSP